MIDKPILAAVSDTEAFCQGNCPGPYLLLARVDLKSMMRGSVLSPVTGQPVRIQYGNPGLIAHSHDPEVFCCAEMFLCEKRRLKQVSLGQISGCYGGRVNDPLCSVVRLEVSRSERLHDKWFPKPAGQHGRVGSDHGVGNAKPKRRSGSVLSDLVFGRNQAVDRTDPVHSWIADDCPK